MHWKVLNLRQTPADRHPLSNVWRRQITGRVQWQRPMMPQTVELDDSGDALFVDPEEDRVMPSRSNLLSGLPLLAGATTTLHAATSAIGCPACDWWLSVSNGVRTLISQLQHLCWCGWRALCSPASHVVLRR